MRLCQYFILLLQGRETSLSKQDFIAATSSKTDDLGAKDAYGLFEIFGSRLESNRDKQLHGKTHQRSGTCPVTSARAVIHAALLASGVDSADKMLRFHFVFKLASFLDAYKVFNQSTSDHTQYTHTFLASALHEFTVRVSKGKFINDDELSLCHDMASEIEANLES